MSYIHTFIEIKRFVLTPLSHLQSTYREKDATATKGAGEKSAFAMFTRGETLDCSMYSTYSRRWTQSFVAVVPHCHIWNTRRRIYLDMWVCMYVQRYLVHLCTNVHVCMCKGSGRSPSSPEMLVRIRRSDLWRELNAMTTGEVAPADRTERIQGWPEVRVVLVLWLHTWKRGSMVTIRWKTLKIGAWEVESVNCWVYLHTRALDYPCLYADTYLCIGGRPHCYASLAQPRVSV